VDVVGIFLCDYCPDAKIARFIFFIISIQPEILSVRIHYVLKDGVVVRALRKVVCFKAVFK
jgi:hypothetical protein